MHRPTMLLNEMQCGSLRVSACRCHATAHVPPTSYRSTKCRASAPSNSSFAAGDVVLGQVVSTGPQGSRVQLLDHAGVLGFLPNRWAPLHSTQDLSMSYEGHQLQHQQHQRRRQRHGSSPDHPVIRPNLVREFQIISHDDGAAKSGQGPLLSAAHPDTAVLWQRVCNVAEMSAQQQDQQQQQQQPQGLASTAAGRVVLAARVVSRNNGGLNVICMGLPAFLPKSLLPFKIRDLYHQQADNQLVGSELPVVVEEVVPERRRLVLNCSAAVAARKAALKPGDLVTGVVTEVQSSYVFVGLDGLDSDNNCSILHRNHVSVCQDFKSMHAVFGVGEQVTALVFSTDNGGRKMALSTAHLEVTAGDMLCDRQAVYAGAAAQAALVRSQMVAMQQQQVQQQEEQVQQQQQREQQHHQQLLQAQQKEELDESLVTVLSSSTQQPERQEHAAPPHHARPSKTARPVIRAEPVVDREPWHDPPLSSYVAGGRLGVVMAAAVWNGQDKWAVDESANGFVDCVKGHVEALGVAGKSVDAEQDWWSAGPLAWGPAEERQQWKEEQQLQGVQKGAAGVAGVGEPDAVGVQQDGFMDGEQQWLLPPVLSEPAV